MDNIMMKNGCSAAGIVHDVAIKATAVEAIVGAVWLDSRDLKVVEEVMRRFGVFWPMDREVEREMGEWLAELRRRRVI
jgi:dsRNA-specific ribonuclease